MVLKMAKTKIGEIEILSFRTEGVIFFRAAAKKAVKFAYFWVSIFALSRSRGLLVLTLRQLKAHVGTRYPRTVEQKSRYA